MGRFAIVGATSWGLTLAWLLVGNGHAVTVVTRTRDEAERIARERGLSRLPGLRLPPAVVFSHEGEFTSCDGVLIAAPAQHVRATVAGMGDCSVPVLSAAKGIEQAMGERISNVIATRWPGVPVGVLSGPNLSAEIVAGRPAAAVVAVANDAVAASWQAALSGARFRCYRSNDVVGVELAGALKNVIAIAAGVAWGLELGANAVAALMTRGLAEMTRLGVALGAEAATFSGLAGIGDLAATCFSPLSRNRRFGELLASGLGAEAARELIGEAVEGIATAHAAVAMARATAVELPICAEVLAVVTGQHDVHVAAAALMERAPATE
jgi:glycerol-3-phosphate dehydrogenase (NAD(P)+)